MAARAGFPAIYFVTRSRRLRRVVVQDWDQLWFLRAELALLRRIAYFVKVAKASGRQVDRRSSFSAEDLDELGGIHFDATSPIIETTCRQVDADFATIQEEIPMSVVNNEAEKIAQEIIDSGAEALAEGAASRQAAAASASNVADDTDGADGMSAGESAAGESVAEEAVAEETVAGETGVGETGVGETGVGETGVGRQVDEPSVVGGSSKGTEPEDDDYDDGLTANFFDSDDAPSSESPPVEPDETPAMTGNEDPAATAFDGSCADEVEPVNESDDCAASALSGQAGDCEFDDAVERDAIGGHDSDAAPMGEVDDDAVEVGGSDADIEDALTTVENDLNLAATILDGIHAAEDWNEAVAAKSAAFGEPTNRTLPEEAGGCPPPGEPCGDAGIGDQEVTADTVEPCAFEAPSGIDDAAQVASVTPDSHAMPAEADSGDFTFSCTQSVEAGGAVVGDGLLGGIGPLGGSGPMDGGESIPPETREAIRQIEDGMRRLTGSVSQALQRQWRQVQDVLRETVEARDEITDSLQRTQAMLEEMSRMTSSARVAHTEADQARHSLKLTRQEVERIKQRCEVNARSAELAADQATEEARAARNVTSTLP